MKAELYPTVASVAEANNPAALAQIYTNLEFNSLPDRAKDYIRQLENGVKFLRQAVSTTGNENKPFIQKRIDLFDILTSSQCNQVLAGIPERQ